ncbi:hypothetical protein V3C21_24840, partial [Salmonella enterica subsp. enterica serovar Paratyphi B]
MRTHRQMDATSAKKIVDTFSDAVKRALIPISEPTRRCVQ